MATLMTWIANNVVLALGSGVFAMYMVYRAFAMFSTLTNPIKSLSDLKLHAAKFIAFGFIIYVAFTIVYSNAARLGASLQRDPFVRSVLGTFIGIGQGLDKLGSGLYEGPFNASAGNASYDTNLLGGFDSSGFGGGSEQFVAPVDTNASGPAGDVTETIETPLMFQPVDEMFKAAEVNALSNQPANAGTGVYVVQAGDTMSVISTHMYGNADRATLLCQANGISDCNSLSVGTELIVPADLVEKAYAPVAEKTSAELNVVFHAAVPSTKNVAIENTSYVPGGWNVIEAGGMSVGAPANMSAQVDGTELMSAWTSK